VIRITLRNSGPELLLVAGEAFGPPERPQFLPRLCICFVFKEQLWAASMQ